MIQLFTILFIFSHFILGLPKPSDVEALSKSNLVMMYSKACTDYFKRPEFQGYDLSLLVQDILQSSTSQSGSRDWIEGKGNTLQVFQFYQKICNSNPDLTFLDGLDRELKEGVAEYQSIVSQLPEIGDLHNFPLPQSIDLISSDNVAIGDMFLNKGRRKSIKLDQLPGYIPKTFVAVEDSRFFEHKGVDEIGILRALMKDSVKTGNRQGASTITQQVARNLFLGLEQTMQRKLQEILISEKIEKQLTKGEILEIYLNLIYFGRNAWGIEKASKSYFGKHAKNLTPIETAFLAGIVHGPNLYRNRPDRIEKRVLFVLNRMKEKGVLPSVDPGLIRELKVLPEYDKYNSGYLRDYITDQIKIRNGTSVTNVRQIRTSIDSKLQSSATEALQEGLVSYERRFFKSPWEGILGNIQDEIRLNLSKIEESEKLRKMEQEKGNDSLFSTLEEKSSDEVPQGDEGWLTPLSEKEREFPLPNGKWMLAVLLDNGGKIGLVSGNTGSISGQSTQKFGLKYGDIFYVHPLGHGNWEPVQIPHVNGAVLVMDTSGRILAMVGGFNYSTSIWNRSTQALRQPGSLMKPFAYLAALQKGIQPNTLLSDEPITFAPTSSGGKAWTPANYEDSAMLGLRPMRWALENSRNVMTAHLLSLIGLEPVRELAQEFGLYDHPETGYSFILGSQETTLVALVKAYAEIANGGFSLSPQIIEPSTDTINNPKISGVDAISLFQIRYLLQGVVERGTASRLSRFAKILAGKTGTTNDSKDAWFIGFTSGMIIGVYVGYDNPKSLGDGSTGAAVALPIFEKVFAESIKHHYLPEPFSAPPFGVVFLPTNRLTGEIVGSMSNETVLEAYRK